ncbi:aminopeptidase P family protein [[Clostridium] innocuum]|nr:aminopeptidase P family protein [[Clostridium] innocuum]
MTVVEKLNKLRALMKERKMDVYMIPTSDFHETEYVGEHFKARSFMSGFTGSAGTLIVCKDCAALWTDGRYFIQAADQLKDSTIDLMKQGEEGVPSIPEYINEHMQMNGVFGFDGRVMNTKQVKDIMDQLKDKHITICAQEDLVGMIWEERPALPTEKGFYLEEKYSGKSTKDKLADIRNVMKVHKATHHIVTSLDDIAWIMNMRGWDISCFPVMLCYLVITENESHIFINKDKLDERMHANFKDNMVIVHAYDDIYEFVKTIPADAAVLLHTSVVNYAITQNLNKEIRIIDCPNPSQLMKARKNEIELENNRKAHIKDAVAMTKFMYWLKNNIGKETITEISASDYLEGLRRAQENNLGLSFNTISAYNEHAAMMHYSANEETNVELKPEGMLLVDSGGQYLEGTTDITRTFVLGPISDEIRTHYTSALRGMIQLSKARFLEGCRGMNLDILARGPLWEMGIDYKCGTGHGVGHLMNVHEGPNGFRWKIVPERNDSCVLEEGMTQSNEPGVYVEGSHGIRHENEMVVRKGEKNEYGQFMYFETITFVPFDLDGLDVSLMTRYDIEWLNAYHAEVFANVSPYLNEAEKEWLKHATRAI